MYIFVILLKVIEIYDVHSVYPTAALCMRMCRPRRIYYYYYYYYYYSIYCYAWCPHYMFLKYNRQSAFLRTMFCERHYWNNSSSLGTPPPLLLPDSKQLVWPHFMSVVLSCKEMPACFWGQHLALSKHDCLSLPTRCLSFRPHPLQRPIPRDAILSSSPMYSYM